MDYSISELEGITGAPKRALIHWAEAGIIKPDPSTDRAGSGKHRRFTRDEALIACIVHVLTAQKSTVGYLLRTAETIRLTLDDKVFGTDHTSWRFHYERAIADQGKNLMLVILDGDEPTRLVLQTDYEGAPENFNKSIFLAMEHVALASVVSLNVALKGLR